MELIKDIIKALIEGLIGFGAENKLSEKRKEYFNHKKGKLGKLFSGLSIILALVLVIAGLRQIIHKKIIGVLLLCAGIGISLSIVVDWGTAEK